MKHWAVWARWVVAVAGVALAVAIVQGIRPRERPVAASPVATGDPDADSEMTNAVSARWSGDAEDFSVTFERQFTYPGGQLRGQGVEVRIDDEESGRQLIAHGAEAEVNQERDAVRLFGQVEMVSSDALQMATEEIAYSRGEAIVRAPGPGTFSDGQVRGRGIDLNYDRNADVLSIGRDAVVEVGGDDETSPVRIQAREFQQVRSEARLRFERQVRLEEATWRIRAGRALAELTGAQTGLRALDLAEDVTVESRRATGGGVQGMRGGTVSVQYAEDGTRVDHVLLSGNASVRMAAGTRGTNPQLTGEFLELGLDDDGAGLAFLNGRGGVGFRVPSPDGDGVRVRATTVTAEPRTGGGLSVSFSGNVEFRQGPTGSASERIVRADALRLDTSGQLDEIAEARFSGAVTVSTGDTVVTAETAIYDLDTATFELLEQVRMRRDTLEATTERAVFDADRAELQLFTELGTPPRVLDRDIRITANAITVLLEGAQVTATGAARTELVPARDARPGETSTTIPALLAADRPVNATADRLEYDGTTRVATYRGMARLWQGESRFTGASISLDAGTGNLAVGGGATTILTMAEDAASSGEVGPEAVEPTSGRANAVAYDDTLRQLVYSGAGHLTGPQGDLDAGRIVVQLAAEGGLEGLEAEGEVEVNESGRVVTGDRLHYAAATVRYDIDGAPATVVENCRRSTGRVVTFFRNDGRLLIDGNASRTRTRSESGCAGTP